MCIIEKNDHITRNLSQKEGCATIIVMRNIYLIGSIVAGIVLVGGAGYALYTNQQTIQSLSKEIATTTSSLSQTADTLAQTEREKDLLYEQLESERVRNDDLEERVEDAEDALGIIVKRQSIDEELLQKYSKVFFLNEHYQPSDLDRIAQKWVAEGKEDEYIHGQVEPFLEDMLEEAADDNIDLRIISAFRSFDEQSQLKGQYTTAYGSGANTFSADQGYSEHQLGTTVDLSTEELGNNYTNIDQTDAFKWLEKNAYKYGFVLSYPEGNSYYIYEPWHWRFVGKDLARELHRDNDYFYDLDQREIDEYLTELFDK